MKSNLTNKFIIQFHIFIFWLWTIPLSAYTNLTPAQVHARLVQGDTLILLDVREVSEYTSGHIAEPTGQLPLTPVNMPWNSGVLQIEYARLPKNIDVIIYCRGGGRSVSAASFLESKGFTRIFNMTGGFSSWTYESRKNGYGDHSGKWIQATAIDPVVIICAETGDTSRIIFPPASLPVTDSIYVELHFASFKEPLPPHIPPSTINGLFQVAALDRFGGSIFTGDSLNLSAPVTIYLHPLFNDSTTNRDIYNVRIFVPYSGWRAVEYQQENDLFRVTNDVLRKWYLVEGRSSTKVQAQSTATAMTVHVFPNPFNNALKINAPPGAIISIFDAMGSFVDQLHSDTWLPDKSIPTGTYFVKIKIGTQVITKKVTYMK